MNKNGSGSKNAIIFGRDSDCTIRDCSNVRISGVYDKNRYEMNKGRDTYE